MVGDASRTYQFLLSRKVLGFKGLIVIRGKASIMWLYERLT